MRKTHRAVGVWFVFSAMIIVLLAPSARAGVVIQPRPGNANRRVIYFATTDDLKYDHTMPALDAELYRQAFLIAARDGVGLQTRDQSLREWQDAPPADATWTFLTGAEQAAVIDPSGKTAWHDIPFVMLSQGDLSKRLEKTESLSRGEFVKDLRDRGYAGIGNASRPGAAAPADAESLLANFNDLSQFAVLRETHRLIRSDGESLDRLGVLVRGYANLGQLTRFHWSIEHDVYVARSLLYAQRMIAENPQSSLALWHRAYAEAMAGWQGLALVDLASAKKVGDASKAPAWVAVLDPLCRYDFRALDGLAAKDRSLAPLATYCSFLTLEHSDCQAATLASEKAALSANPTCLRIIDAMCRITGPGMLNDLSDQGPQVFSDLLGRDLETMPDLPAGIIQAIHQLKQPGGNAQGRETICQALIAQGTPANDPDELSWAALGRDIQETTFAHIRTKADLIAVQWGVDASDYAAEVQPLIAEHPMKPIIDAYGAMHEQTMDDAASALKKISWRHLTASELPLCQLETAVNSRGPSTMIDLINQFAVEQDNCSYDREAWMVLYHSMLQGRQTEDTIFFLSFLDPQSPWVSSFNILNHWNPRTAGQWRQPQYDYPLIQKTLGDRYTRLRQYDDAERCYRSYLAVSPDVEGYRSLAKLYRSQHRDDRWLATLKEFLDKTDAIGLEHAQVQTEIADYYMDKDDFRDAVPYADAAAETQSGWGLLEAAKANSGAGNFDEAEQDYIAEYQHYSDTPWMWYAWCVRTGHGHRDDAARAMLAYFGSRNPLSDEDELEQAFVQYSIGKTADAIASLEVRLARWPGPLSAAHIAVFADEAGNRATRDRALQYAAQHHDVTQMGRFVELLKSTYQAGPNAPLDLAEAGTLAVTSDPDTRIAIGYLTAKYLLDHGKKALAIDQVKQCYFVYTDHFADQLLIDDLARQLGLDPVQLERNADKAKLSNVAPNRSTSPQPRVAARSVGHLDRRSANYRVTPDYDGDSPATVITEAKRTIALTSILAVVGGLLTILSMVRFARALMRRKVNLGATALTFVFGCCFVAMAIYEGKIAVQKIHQRNAFNTALTQMFGRAPDQLDLHGESLYSFAGTAHYGAERYQLSVRAISNSDDGSTYQLLAQQQR